MQSCDQRYRVGTVDAAAPVLVGAWWLEAEIAALRATGRTSDIPKLRQQQVQRLKDREELVKDKCAIGLSPVLDLPKARGDRLDAEILLEESLH